MKTNSQIMLSPKLYLGDIDGDSLNELIEVDGRQIHIFKCEYDHKPLLTHVFPSPVKRLIIGDFVVNGREKGKDQIFAILEDGSIRGYAISDDLTEMWWWFTQPNFIHNNEHYIVGDFDGDGADEIMVYNPSNGSIKLFEKEVNGILKEMTGYSLGNLSSHDLKRKLLITGNFGQTRDRDDLLVIDKSRGQVKRFDTATDSNGVKTFWSAFTSKTNLFSKDDDVIVANLYGSPYDELLIRKYNTGTYKMFALEYNNGNLRTIDQVDIGQLPVQAQKGTIIASKVRDKNFRYERGGIRRDDILFFNDKNREFIRTDARFDKNASKRTYWWAYTSNLICEPVPSVQKKPWAIILCRFKGMPGNTAIEKFFREIYTPGSGGLVEYWHDVSLGSIDVSGTKVFGWVELEFERKDAALKRDKLIDAAIKACQNVGIDPINGFHKQLAVFTHDFSQPNAPAGANWRTPGWGQFWLDGSADGQGRVSAPPHGHNGSFLAHEMGHGMNFKHDLKADLTTPYGDRNCIMSAMAIKGFTHPKWNKTFGPSMSFPQLDIKNLFYKRRIYTADKYWSTNGLSFNMAPQNDRRINASLGAIIPTSSSSGWDYYLEYIRPNGWNKGLSKPILVIRRVVGNTAAFLGEIELPVTLHAKKSWREPSGNVLFTIQKIRSDERMIKVILTKPKFRTVGIASTITKIATKKPIVNRLTVKPIIKITK
ncbi:MAG: hypothetical protein JKY03_01535 [Aureispira sp.]|nr:hypothetical protein [Aureispira sp.]